MEPVLTQEELEAIYSAMNADAAAPAPVDDFSLTTGREFIAQATDCWTTAARAMVPHFEGLLSGALAKRIKLDVPQTRLIEEAGENPFGAAEGSGSEPAAIRDDTAIINTVTIGQTNLLLGIDRLLSLKYIERRTGADMNSEESESKERDLTVLEHRLLKDLLRDVVNVAGRTTSQVREASVLSIDALDVWKDRDPLVPWMEVLFHSPNHNEVGLWFRGPALLFFPQPTAARKMLASQIEQATVELSAELGRFQLKVSELWEVRPGTIIPINATVGDPLPVLIGGVTKLQGQPLVSRGNIAIRILERFKNRSESDEPSPRQ